MGRMGERMGPAVDHCQIDVRHRGIVSRMIEAKTLAPGRG
jgi:hypothetical protein